MKSACRSFRTLLEEKLVGRPDPTRLSALSWHQHLLGCGACRALFETEETLEVLPATLPEPNLPPEIRRRVLAALARSRSADRPLDRLLERDADLIVPAGIARDVLARLEPLRLGEEQRSGENLVRTGGGDPRERRLDALLDLAGPVHVPADLARRTLERLAASRGAEVGSNVEAGLDALLARAAFVDVPRDLTPHILAGVAHARPGGTRRPKLLRSAWAFAAAATLVAALLAWAVWPKQAESVPDMADGKTLRNDPGHARPKDDVVARAPDPGMLAALEVLENWDFLMQSDVDVILSTTEPADELLLEYEDEG